MLTTLCVFCASSRGTDARYVAAARAFGEMLAVSGRRIVYGGGNTGLMGALADGALAAGGEIIGVMPAHLVEREVAHRGLTRLDVVASMHDRKARLAEMADGFVALPGGLGTLEEVLEILSFKQLGFHGKPVVLLNAAGYWDPLLAMLERGFAEGFVQDHFRGIYTVAADPAAAIAQIEGPATWPPARRDARGGGTA